MTFVVNATNLFSSTMSATLPQARNDIIMYPSVTLVNASRLDAKYGEGADENCDELHLGSLVCVDRD